MGMWDGWVVVACCCVGGGAVCELLVRLVQLPADVPNSSTQVVYVGVLFLDSSFSSSQFFVCQFQGKMAVLTGVQRA